MNAHSRLRNLNLSSFDKMLKILLVILYIMLPIMVIFTFSLIELLVHGSSIALVVVILGIGVSLCMYSCIILIGIARNWIAGESRDGVN